MKTITNTIAKASLSRWGKWFVVYPAATVYMLAKSTLVQVALAITGLVYLFGYSSLSFGVKFVAFLVGFAMLGHFVSQMWWRSMYRAAKKK